MRTVVSHHERVTMRVGDTYLKVDVDDARLEREVAVMRLVDVATPPVLWRRPNVLALAALHGFQLGRLGEPSTATAGAWEAAGSAARQIHTLPLPPWTGWDADGFAAYVDGDCRWLVDNRTAPRDVVERARRRVGPALRPFPFVFTHGDYQAAHVLVDGDAVTASSTGPTRCKATRSGISRC